MAATGCFHQPVMVEEAAAYMVGRRDGIYIDATVGGGGHAREIASRLEASGRLLGIDRDAEAVAVAGEVLKGLDAGISIVQGEFANLKALALGAGVVDADGVLFDLGVSGHDLDSAERGFSYLKDGPLDLRMDRAASLDAATVVARSTTEQLADIFFNYGQERHARRLARAVVAARARRPITTTAELARVIKEVTNPRYHNKTLSRVFQALRIVVNDELEQLKKGLADALELLRVGGRLVVISYHSLEDGIVKNYFRETARRQDGELARIITPRPLWPQVAEVERNPRARSARMRVLEKTGNA